jgi:hypothetical protein
MKFQYTDSPLLSSFISWGFPPGPVSGFSTSDFELSGSVYAGYLWGFKRNFIGQLASIEEYKGGSVSLSAGFDPTMGVFKVVSTNFGLTGFASTSVLDPQSMAGVRGVAFYGGAGVGLSETPISLNLASMNYEVTKRFPSRYNTAEEMARDIALGTEVPTPFNSGLANSLLRTPTAMLVQEIAHDEEWAVPIPESAAQPTNPDDPNDLVDCSVMMGVYVLLR